MNAHNKALVTFMFAALAAFLMAASPVIFDTTNGVITFPSYTGAAPAVGSIWYDGTMDAFRVRDSSFSSSGGVMRLVGMTTAAAVGNFTSEQILASITPNAGWLKNGKRYRLSSWGLYGFGTGTPTFTLRHAWAHGTADYVNMGGQSLAVTGSSGWHIVSEIVGTGASTAGRMQYIATVATPATDFKLTTITSGTLTNADVNARALSVTGQWSAAHSGNTVTVLCHELVEVSP